MRTGYTLWRVSNGWLLVPEKKTSNINTEDAGECAVFKTLKEFSEYQPKRVRKPRTAKPKETPDANQH